MAYQGTLLLVSHDREFLDQVVTSTLVFEQGQVNQYVGGYQDWLRQRPGATDKPKAAASSAATAKPRSTEKKKLSYKEQRELEQLPGQIETLEQQIAGLQQTLSDPAFFQRPADQISETTDLLAKLEAELEQAFARWAELDQQTP